MIFIDDVSKFVMTNADTVVQTTYNDVSVCEHCLTNVRAADKH